MKARVKFHQMPGDIRKSQKIRMMEGKPVTFEWNPSSLQSKIRRAKKYKKLMLAKERAVIKRQTRKLLNEQL